MAPEPDPGYFQFDDIIEKLPGIYHAFALSTLGLVERLCKSCDLQGSTLADICAGTGRCALTLASAVSHVYAVELQRGPSLFACKQIRARRIANVTYLRGDANTLPLRSMSVDHAVGMWGVVNRREAERIVRPGGRVLLGGCAPGNMVGELSPRVAHHLQDQGKSTVQWRLRLLSHQVDP
ncbi:MAG: class I SAM-dependent methyltransferase [Myxococcota bacterium]